MTKPLPAALRLPVTDLASGQAWLEALVDTDLSFHLEDDPADIITIGTDEPVFAADDLPLIRERVAQLYELDWGDDVGCPIGYLLDLGAEEGL